MTTVDFKTLPELLVNAVANFGDKEGYRYFDHQQSQWVSVTWKEFHARVMRWRKAFAAMGLQRGDRVSMLLVNSLDALTFDQAALANALVPVPLHSIDTPDSSAYILSDSGSKFLVTTTRARWNAIAATTSSDISAIELTNYALTLFPMLNSAQIKTQSIPVADGFRYANVDGKAVLLPDMEKNLQALSDVLT